MDKIFKVLEVRKGEEGEAGVSIAIDLRVGDREAPFTITRFCRTEEDLEAEAESIRKHLDHALGKARAFLERDATKGEESEFSGDMSVEEIWDALDRVEDEKTFIEKFNALDEIRRRDVAEHVLAECNVFKGKASVFSTRYNNETASLE